MPSNDRPIFQEMQGKDWVSYGANDTYAQYLEGLYLGSSIHSAIVSGVGAMIYGEGLDAKDREQSDGTREQWLRLQNLLGESDPELLRKLALDLKLYGQCYVNTIWNTARTQIVRMCHQFWRHHKNTRVPRSISVVINQLKNQDLLPSHPANMMLTICSLRNVYVYEAVAIQENEELVAKGAWAIVSQWWQGMMQSGDA